MTSAKPFLTTVDGATTSYLPLATAWPSAGPDCASGVYRQNNGNFMGWDPWYMQNIDTRLFTCWPPEASTWWTQSALPTTILGPVFVCPEQYYEAHTSTLDSHTTQTICCPSHYMINVPAFAPAFPSQCISTVTAPQSLSWQYIDGSLRTNSTVVPGTSTLTVFGWPVNGLNVVASSTATPTGSSVTGNTASATGTTGPTSTPSSTSTSTPSSTSNAATSAGDTSDNLGLIVGTTVGVVFGVLLVALGAFLVWRKRRAGRPRGRKLEQIQMTKAQSALAPEARYPAAVTSELPVVDRAAELNVPRNVYELPQ